MRTSIFFSVLIMAFASSRILSQITPPAQLATGPGGLNYPYTTYDSSRYGTDITNMYWLFEPASPSPDSVPVIVVFHGTLQNYMDSTLVPLNEMYLLHHFAKKGYIVIYPLYQYGGNTLLYQQQLTVSAGVINLALTELDNGAHVKPKRDLNGKVMIGATGYSRGGMMSLEIANNYQSLGLPAFDAVADFVGGGNYDSYAGLPSTTKIIIVRAKDDAYNIASLQEIEQAWDSLYNIPCSNKNYLEINSDSLGSPPLTANHYFFVADPNISNSVDALDYFGSWKFCIALFNCTFYGTNCSYVFGAGSNVTSMGNWSNGTPVTQVTLLDSCSTTGIEENGNDVNSEIDIYPNPNNGEFAVYGLQFPVQIQIYNSLGQKVHKQTINSRQESINLLESKGIYFYRVITPSPSGEGWGEVVSSGKFIME
ncbi:MAG: T9SS type A sorting domain-containing protein [Bacteroidetes bacterium]|nr:T9SS type A sorting domain-containing protein [Bacteroidota bacterium]